MTNKEYEIVYEFLIVRLFPGNPLGPLSKREGINNIPKDRKADVAIWLRGESDRLLKEYKQDI